MKSFELVRFALGAIVAHPMRSALTSLGVVIGVAAVVLMTSIGQGAQQQVTSTISGLGSNLDVDSIVTQLMTLEKKPLTLLTTEAAATKTRISAFGSLKSLVSTFQSAMASLTAQTFGAVKAATSDSTIATAAASSGAPTGTHSLEILTLAQAQKIKSTAFPATTTAVGSGTLTFRYGTTSGSSFSPLFSRPRREAMISLASSLRKFLMKPS